MWLYGLQGNDTEPYYNFPLVREDSWGLTTDYIRLPKEAMQGSYQGYNHFLYVNSLIHWN